jgi:hypothetical protein
MTKKPATRAAKKPATKPAAKSASKAASKSAGKAVKKNPPAKPAARSVKSAKAAAKPAAKPASKTAAKPAAKPAAASKPAGLWSSLSSGFSATADAAASASLLALLPPGAATALFSHVAQALGAQFTRATAAARKQVEKHGPTAAGFAAAQSILDSLKVYAGTVDEIRAQAKEIGETFLALEKSAQKKFQAELSRLALAVTQERSLADVPALMRAAIARVLAEAPVPKKGKKATAA